MHWAEKFSVLNSLIAQNNNFGLPQSRNMPKFFFFFSLHVVPNMPKVSFPSRHSFLSLSRLFGSNLFFYCLPSSGIASCVGTLVAALLCSSRAGSDLGRESRLGWRTLSIGFLHSQVEVYDSPKGRQGDAVWYQFLGTIASRLVRYCKRHMSSGALLFE